MLALISAAVPPQASGDHRQNLILPTPTGRAQRAVSASADDVAYLSERAPEVSLHVFAITPIGVMDPIGQSRERQGLQPHASRAGQGREEQPFAAEQAGL